ncbi:MFS transporter [Candidatus Galacturonibacter soehngenii]|uniref:MFS transporter n=1 Tax=Candidatus Galacturonatibacter soehngenii TaxID=2307010 RepID=A0A7V7UC18_9FIRM|nr:MFS transporter [Candidatus Galacturonibacter soehngenii]KAB1438678.1 MFS transporter [Candidatus Galacturonibacter soehngenii]
MKTEKLSNQDRLPVGKFLAWKARDISIACVTVIMTYLTIFCTDALGMPAALVGTLLLASKTCDGITDIFAGFLVDNTNTRWGKGRPYEWCILGAWGCTILLFFCPGNWSLVIKSVWVFVMYTLVFSIFSTMLGASQTPYMIRAFKSKVVIGKVASYGGILSMIGAIIISVTFPILMAKLAVSTAGWRTLILIYGLPLAGLGILRFIYVKEDPSIDAGAVGQQVSLTQIIELFKKNKYAWAYAGIMGFYQMTVGLNVTTFYFKYVVGDLGLMGIMGMMSVVVLPVMFIFPTLMKKFNVSTLIIGGSFSAIIGYLLMFLAKSNMPMLIAGNVLMTVASLPIAYLGAIIIMELATYNESIGLPRMEGSTNILSSFSNKVFNGVGAGIVGVLLGAAGYSSNAGAVQPEGALLMIRVLYSIVPLICFVLIILCALVLGKLEKKIPQLEKELEEKKEESKCLSDCSMTEMLSN